MRKLNTALAVLFIAALYVSIPGQGRMSGKVIEVIDGKTVVVDTGGRTVKAEIQYIEVPEPEQQLRAVVRDHLEKLTLGKTVEFRPQGFAPGKAFGQLLVGDVDVAAQMLRDGAAWHIPAERSGQDSAESAAYRLQQEQAHAEKRGVWGVTGLKPAWEFRAEKGEKARLVAEEKERQTFAAVAAEKNTTPPAVKQPLKGTGFWADTNPWLKNPGPLMNGYNAASGTGYVGTSFMGVKEQEGQPADQKTAVDVTYFYKQNDGKGRTGTFVLTVVSASGQERFAKSGGIVVIVDEKNYPVGKPKRTVGKEEGKVVEKLTYEMNKATVEKIVYGGEVFIKIGDYMIYPTPGFQLLLYNMLQVAG